MNLVYAEYINLKKKTSFLNFSHNSENSVHLTCCLSYKSLILNIIQYSGIETGLVVHYMDLFESKIIPAYDYFLCLHLKLTSLNGYKDLVI